MKRKQDCLYFDDSTDVFSTVPKEIHIFEIVSFLDDALDIVHLASTCKYMRSILIHSHAAKIIWLERCKKLWVDKIYVHPRFRKNSTSPFSYFGSIHDSRRCRFEDETELNSLHFHFRFRPSAGSFWLSLDPSFNGCAPMYRRFELDGDIKSSPDVCASNTDGMPITKECTGAVIDPLDNVGIPKIYWRFTKSRRGKKGQFVKLNNWPSAHVGRTEDWGWTLTSVWTYYRTCCDATRNLKKEWMSEAEDYYLYV